MADLAVGYVSIVPKFGGGFKDAIASQLGGASAPIGKSVGGGFKDTFLGVLAGNLMTSAISKIGGTIKGAIGGGFARLMNIEQAEIKLKTLGLNVEAAMGSVSKAVDGTKFAISDAADMAAFLGASGIAAGQDMTRWLSLTADAAQFTNRDFTDMQRVIGKVIAEGRATGETFQELPLAAAALADHLGISQQEVRKLASAGKISAEEFAAAMESKIGGSAKNAGASFLSMASNLKTALNATMANLLKPFTKALMPIMESGLTLVKSFRDGVAKPLGESFSGWLQPKAEAFAGAMLKLPSVVSAIMAPIGSFVNSFKAADGGLLSLNGTITTLQVVGLKLGTVFYAIRDAVLEFGNAVAAGLGLATLHLDGTVTGVQAFGVKVGAAILAAKDVIATYAGRLFDGLKVAVGGIQDMWAGLMMPTDVRAEFAGQTDGLVAVGAGLREKLSGIFGGIKDLVVGFVDGFGGMGAIGGTLESLLPVLMGPLGLIKSALMGVLGGEGSGMDWGALGQTLGASLSPILTAAADLAALLTGALAGAFETLLPLALDLGGTLLQVGGDLLTGLVPVIADLTSTLLPPLLDAFASLVPVVLGLLETVAPLVSLLLEQLAPVVSDLVSALLPPLVSVFGTLVGAIAPIVEALMPLVEVLLSQLVPVIATLVAEVLPPLAGVFAEVADLLATVLVPMVTALVEVFAAVLTPVIEALLPVVTSVFEAVAEIIGGVLTELQGIIQTVTGVISGDWDQVWNGIQTFFSGVWDTIKAIVSGAVNVVASTLQAGLSLAWSIVVGIFNAIVDFVMSIPGRIMDGLSGLAMLAVRAAEWVGGFKDRAVAKFFEVVDWVRGVPGMILSALGSLGTYLTDAGRQLINGFMDGVAAMANKLKDSVLAPIKGAVSGVKNFLGIASPSKLFFGIGVNAGEGLQLGMDSMRSEIEAAADRMAGSALPDIGTSDMDGPSGRFTSPADIASAIRAGLAGARFYLDGREVAVRLGFDDLALRAHAAGRGN